MFCRDSSPLWDEEENVHAKWPEEGEERVDGGRKRGRETESENSEWQGRKEGIRNGRMRRNENEKENQSERRGAAEEERTMTAVREEAK